MKKAPQVRLSLRKLFIAMLAVGPIAILPSSLLAVVPVPQPFTVVSGTVTWTGSTAGQPASTLATITTSSGNSIVSWGQGNFTIAAGETFNFNFTTGNGAILNKVGYTTAGNALATPDNAIINGNLQSNGRVFIVANGDIIVGPGAQINTQGLFLSTLVETDNISFPFSGNISANGTAQGNITIGGAGTRANLSGPLGAWGNRISLDNVSIVGDVILNSRSSTQPLSLAGPAGMVNITGNLSASTTGTDIAQIGTFGPGPDGILGTPDDVLVTPANSLTVSGTATFNAATANVILGNVQNNFVTVNATGNRVLLADANDIFLGNSTMGAGGLSVGAGGTISTVGTLTVGGSGTTSLSAGGAITIANNSTLSGPVSASTTSGAISLNTAGALTTGAVSAGGGGGVAITTTGTLTLTGAMSGATLALTGASISSSGTPSATTPQVAGGTATFNATSGSIILPAVTANEVVVSAPLGSISQLATTTVPPAPANNIITTSNGSTSSFTASPTGTISLTNPNQLGAPLTAAGTVIPVGSARFSGGTVSVNNTRALAVGDTTTTGSLTINTTAAGTAGAVTIGSGFGTAATGIRVGGALNITTGSAPVSDDNYAPWDVFGAVTINTTATGTGAAVALTAAGEGVRVSLGQVNVNSGVAITNVIETTTLNLGTISAGLIQANSTLGSIVQSGVLTSASIAGNTGNPQNRFAVTNNAVNSIILDNPANVFTTASTGDVVSGNITIVGGNNNILTSASHVRMDNRTNVSGGNMTISATGNIIMQGGNYRNLTLNATDSVRFEVLAGQTLTTNRLQVFAGSANATAISSAAVTGNRNLTNNGILTLSTPGGVMLNHPNNNLNIVTINNVTLDSVVYSRTGFTINGATPANVLVAAGTQNLQGSEVAAGRYDMALGDLNFGSLTAWSLNGVTPLTGLTATSPGTFSVPVAAGGIGGNIIQQNATTSVHVVGTTTLVTNAGDVRLTNNNNSFGRVNAATGGTTTLPGAAGPAGSISITEYDTLRVGNVTTNGTVTLTSRFGSIIEDPIGTNIIARGGLTLIAPNGSILLGNVSNNTTSEIGAATITAAGSASVFSAGNIVLGAINANSLTVTADNISQSAPLSIFGQASFNAGRRDIAGASVPAFATSTGDIVLTNPANNFGPLVLTTVNANRTISVAENSTLNLRMVSTPVPVGFTSNTTFTANSINGDIVDSGLGFVRLGGTVANNNATSGQGVVTLLAPNGNIELNDPTTDIVTTGGVVFNANNVTLSLLGTPNGTVALGAATTSSSATGNLSVTSAQGGIVSGGAMTVGGTASFVTGLGDITLLSPGLRFGQIHFSGGTVRITETGAMDVLSSSRASGAAQLESLTGGIVIIPVGSQVATFGSTVDLRANGDIILRAMQAFGTVRLNHTGTANLSALRLSDLLGNPQWFDQGPGPFIPPSQ